MPWPYSMGLHERVVAACKLLGPCADASAAASRGPSLLGSPILESRMA